MWERTVMGISVHTAETEMAKNPYYIYLYSYTDSDMCIDTYSCSYSY